MARGDWEEVLGGYSLTFSTVLKCLWLMTHPQGLEGAQEPLQTSTLAMALLFQRTGQSVVRRGTALPWLASVLKNLLTQT